MNGKVSGEGDLASLESTAMPHNHDTTRRVPSETFPGVSVVLRKMTEGRRIELRKLVAEPNRRVREILREQGTIEVESEEKRDMPKWLELQDEFDGIMLEKVNPAWITWGVKQVEGLQVDGRSLGVDDWGEWPSALFNEVLAAVKDEAELNGVERKNLGSPTTFGAPAGSTPKGSTVGSVGKEGGGESETAGSTSQVN